MMNDSDNIVPLPGDLVRSGVEAPSGVQYWQLIRWQDNDARILDVGIHVLYVGIDALGRHVVYSSQLQKVILLKCDQRFKISSRIALQ